MDHSLRNVRNELKRKPMMLVITYAFFQQKCTKMNEVVTSLLQPEINRDFEKLNEWRKSFDEEGENF